jgi:anti-sigma B factor antagonist
MSLSPGSREFNVTVVRLGTTSVLSVRGELDLTTASQLTRRVVEELATTTDLVFDLSETTFIDSSGLTVFIRARNRAREAGGSIVLRSPQVPVLRALLLMGLDQIMTIDDPEHLSSNLVDEAQHWLDHLPPSVS